jgi:hypothetical protein
MVYANSILSDNYTQKNSFVLKKLAVLVFSI